VIAPPHYCNPNNVEQYPRFQIKKILPLKRTGKAIYAKGLYYANKEDKAFDAFFKIAANSQQDMMNEIDFIKTTVHLKLPHLVTYFDILKCNNYMSVLEKEKDNVSKELLQQMRKLKFGNDITIYFNIMSNVKGYRLDQFLENMYKKLPEGSQKIKDVQLAVAMQISELVQQMELLEIMHNDLHTQNIFIREKDVNDVGFGTKFPWKKYEITVIDWDLVYTSKIQRQKFHSCFNLQKFTPKLDWYIFMTWFLRGLQVNGHPFKFEECLLKESVAQWPAQANWKDFGDGKAHVSYYAAPCTKKHPQQPFDRDANPYSFDQTKLDAIQSPKEFSQCILKKYKNRTL
jgi:serine/threonine protein kinase